MNSTDPIVPQPGLPGKLAEMSVQAVGQVALFAVGAFLIVSWLLTAPIFHLFDLCRARFNPKAKRKSRRNRAWGWRYGGRQNQG